ncbi:MAG: OmpH family outer membrane protein [Candidatus Omnitrophica bacterium]|nr:OmpH family outer membrane protein [Candidatus Omnitrophota bacterium]
MQLEIGGKSIFRIVVWLFLMSTFFAAASSCGRKPRQAVTGDKVGFVDLAAIFEEYSKVEKYDKQIEELSKVKKDERTGITEEIRKTQDSLALLSESAKQDKEKELEKQFGKLEEFDNAAREELTKRRNELLKEVFDDIEKVVQDYADENKYDMIFTSRSLIFRKEQYDVTPPVLRELNRRHEHQVAAA